MILTEELVAELTKVIAHIARQVLPEGRQRTFTSNSGTFYTTTGEIEDIIQDMLLKIIEDRGNKFSDVFERKGKPGLTTYVCRCTKNHVLNHLRDTSREIAESQLGENSPFRELFGDGFGQEDE